MVSLARELVSKWMKSDAHFFQLTCNFCIVRKVVATLRHKYIFKRKAVSATVEVAELITKIAEGLFFKTE